MSKRDPAKTANYAVGYGRPPRTTQFKPGQSGNPKGRRKGTRSVGAIIQDILQQRVKVTEGEKTRHLPAIEVMFHRLKNDALRGDLKAFKFFLALWDRYEASPETKVKMDELTAEDQEILDRFLRPSESQLGGTPVDSTNKKEPGDDV
jgi:hypothetical protein